MAMAKEDEEEEAIAMAMAMGWAGSPCVQRMFYNIRIRMKP